MKYGKMIDVFVFQDILGSKVHVDFVLKIQFQMLNKHPVFAKNLMSFTVLSKTYVFIVQLLLTLMDLDALTVKKMLNIM